MSLSEDAPGFTVHCITEKPKDMDPSMTSEWKIFNVLWHTQPTHFITVGGSLIPLFYYLYTLYIFRAFSSEIPQRQVVVTTQKSHCSCLQIRFPTPRVFSWMFSPLPKHRWTFRDYKKCISLILETGVEQGGLRLGFFSGEVSLVESNGLVGTRVSVESHNLGPRSLHWPECLSGPPQTACGAGRRSNRDRGSSCFAVSSFCGSRDPLPLGVSEIAAGSERDTHLKGRRHRSNTPPTYLTNLPSLFSNRLTNLFSFRRLCCYCCWQPLPWL